MTVHEVVHFDDGQFCIPTLPLTLRALVRHAEKFSTEEVDETAETDPSH
jgi:hypothetical protein